MHGIWLWLRRLPIQPRPDPPPGRCPDDHQLPNAARPTTGPASTLVPPARARPSRPGSRAGSSPPPSTGSTSPCTWSGPTDADPRQGRPGDDRPPAGGVLRPDRPAPADRVRRGLPHRRLGHRAARGPRRLPHRARRRDADPRPRAAAEAARGRGQAPAAPRAEQHQELAGQHRAPLRPLQRPVRAVPRPDAQLLLGAVPRATCSAAPPGARTSRPRSTPRSTGCSTRPASARAPGCSRSAPAGASSPSAPPAAAPPSAPSRCRSSRRTLADRRIAAAGVSDRVVGRAAATTATSATPASSTTPWCRSR